MNSKPLELLHWFNASKSSSFKDMVCMIRVWGKKTLRFYPWVGGMKRRTSCFHFSMTVLTAPSPESISCFWSAGIPRRNGPPAAKSAQGFVTWL